MSLGIGELIVLGFVVVVVFSAARMGSLGNALGKFIYAFKRASKGEGFVDVSSKKLHQPDSGSAGSEDAEFEEPKRRS